MLRLAFDFIITWRETRTRPNAYSHIIVEIFLFYPTLTYRRVINTYYPVEIDFYLFFLVLNGQLSFFIFAFDCILNLCVKANRR